MDIWIFTLVSLLFSLHNTGVNGLGVGWQSPTYILRPSLVSIICHVDDSGSFLSVFYLNRLLV